MMSREREERSMKRSLQELQHQQTAHLMAWEDFDTRSKAAKTEAFEWITYALATAVVLTAAGVSLLLVGVAEPFSSGANRALAIGAVASTTTAVLMAIFGYVRWTFSKRLARTAKEQWVLALRLEENLQAERELLREAEKEAALARATEERRKAAQDAQARLEKVFGGEAPDAPSASGGKRQRAERGSQVSKGGRDI